MVINSKRLKEVTLCKVKVLAPDEHFYTVPNASRYALSTYGRLYETTSKGRHKKVETLYIRDGEAYKICFDGTPMPEIITIRRLMAMVFFPDQPGIYLVNPKCTAQQNRWRLDDLHVLHGKDDVVEYILSKLERRDATYSNDRKGNTFVNRADFDKSLRSTISNYYWGMYSRATNSKLKKRHPQYKDTTIDPALTLDAFIEWYIANWYHYPGKLSIDKDILGFGRTNCYKLGLIAIVPQYINNIFTEATSQLGYCIKEQTRTNGEKYYKIPSNAFILDGKRQKDIFCDTYIAALHAGRKRKADYIRAIVAKEKSAGYMPMHILKAMEKWANLCELGLVRMWEPSEKTLVEMGVI